MKQVIPGIVVIAVVTLGIVAIVRLPKADTQPHAVADTEHGVLVDDSIANGKSWKAQGPTIDGGVDVSCLKVFDGGVDDNAVTDFTVTNTSSTCVRVGVDSTVDSTHGIAVGNGCAAGQILPMHAKKCRAQSEGAQVIFDVSGGRP